MCASAQWAGKQTYSSAAGEVVGATGWLRATRLTRYTKWTLGSGLQDCKERFFFAFYLLIEAKHCQTDLARYRGLEVQQASRRGGRRGQTISWLCSCDDAAPGIKPEEQGQGKQVKSRGWRIFWSRARLGAICSVSGVVEGSSGEHQGCQLFWVNN